MGTLRAGDMGTFRVHGDTYGIRDPWGWGHEGLGTWGPLGLGTWGPSGFMGTPMGSGTLRDGDMGTFRVQGDTYGIGDPQGWGHGDLQGSGGHLWDREPSGMGT